MPDFLIQIFIHFFFKACERASPSQLLTSLETICHQSETIVKEVNVNLKRMISNFIICSILL